MSVLRYIDFATGTVGSELVEATRIDVDELSGIVNGLCDVGYLETDPPMNEITPDVFPTLLVDVNPSYALSLREAMSKRL